MPETVTHPTPQVLSALAAGQLPEAAAITVGRHIEGCASCRHAMARLATSLPPELAQHSKYRIVRELGRGGMGVVYQAVQTLMDRPVAIKVINPSVLEHADALPRFQAEVKAAAKLDHPNIVRAYDADQVGSLHLLVMEFVEGRNLADVVQQKGPLPVAHACHYIRQAALGLQHAFEQGMTHRDIKPHNLMLASRGMVKILDFGLARLRTGRPQESGLTASGSFMGTPDYVAPEQATDARTADTRSDLYSLGCTLYHLLTGRPPFEEDTTVKLVLAHIEKEPPPLHSLRPDVPAELAAVVSRLLAKDPAQRYQTPVEVAQALVPFIKAGATPPAPVATAAVASPGRATVTGGDTRRAKSSMAKPGLTAAATLTATEPATGSAQPAIVTLPKTTPSQRRGIMRRWPIVTGAGGTLLALGLVAWLLAAVVFKSPQTDAEVKALLMLEVDQPGAKVLLDGQPLSVNLRDANGPLKIDVTPGKHKLRISKTGFIAVTRDLELQAGDSTPLKVRLERIAPVTVAQPRPAELPKVSPPALDLPAKGPDLAAAPTGPATHPTPEGSPTPSPAPETKEPTPASPAPSRPAPAPASADPLRRDIERAQTVYNDKVKRADAQLLAAFRRELRLVRSQHLKPSRQLKIIEDLTREQTAFEQNQTMPWSPRMRHAAVEYMTALRAAGRPLRSAYDAAIAHYTRVGPLSMAEQLKTERGNALAPRVAGRWNCTGITFRRQYSWVLYVDGSANDRNHMVGWKFEHQYLVIRSKGPRVPGGIWVDTCTIASDGQSFTAVNQKRARYKASLQ